MAKRLWKLERRGFLKTEIPLAVVFQKVEGQGSVSKCIAEGVVDGTKTFKAGDTFDMQKESSETEPLAVLRVDKVDTGNLEYILFSLLLHLQLLWI
jgi:hypothetical protein